MASPRSKLLQGGAFGNKVIQPGPGTGADLRRFAPSPNPDARLRRQRRAGLPAGAKRIPGALSDTSPFKEGLIAKTAPMPEMKVRKQADARQFAGKLTGRANALVRGKGRKLGLKQMAPAKSVRVKAKAGGKITMPKPPKAAPAKNAWPVGPAYRARRLKKQ